MSNKVISTLRQNLVDGIRFHQEARINSALTRDATLTSNFLGQHHGVDVGKLLAHFINAPNLKFNVENSVIYNVSELRVIETFNGIGLFGYGSKEFLFHTQLGLIFLVEYCVSDGGLAIVNLKVDLCWIEGNTWWMKDSSLIDFSVNSHRHHTINSRDIPVSARTQTFQHGDTIQEIRSRVYQYAWILDIEDTDILEAIAVRDFTVYDGFHDRLFKTRHEWCEFVHYLNEKEPAMQHSFRILNIEYDSNSAIVQMRRFEPDRIGSKVINAANWWHDWYTLDYRVKLVREDCWKLATVEFSKINRSGLSQGLLNKCVAANS